MSQVRLRDIKDTTLQAYGHHHKKNNAKKCIEGLKSAQVVALVLFIIGALLIIFNQADVSGYQEEVHLYVGISFFLGAIAASGIFYFFTRHAIHEVRSQRVNLDKPAKLDDIISKDNFKIFGDHTGRKVAPIIRLGRQDPARFIESAPPDYNLWQLHHVLVFKKGPKPNQDPALAKAMMRHPQLMSHYIGTGSLDFVCNAFIQLDQEEKYHFLCRLYNVNSDHAMELFEKWVGRADDNDEAIFYVFTSFQQEEAPEIYLMRFSESFLDNLARHAKISKKLCNKYLVDLPTGSEAIDNFIEKLIDKSTPFVREGVSWHVPDMADSPPPTISQSIAE